MFVKKLEKQDCFDDCKKQLESLEKDFANFINQSVTEMEISQIQKFLETE